MPSVIAYILNETSYDSLGYVGHSEGTTQMFASLISYVSITVLFSFSCVFSGVLDYNLG